MKRFSITQTQLNRLKLLSGSNEAISILDSLPVLEGLVNLEYATGGLVGKPEKPSVYGDMYGLFGDQKETVLPNPEITEVLREWKTNEDLQIQKLREIESERQRRKAEIQQLGRPRHKPVQEIKVWIDEAKDVTVDRELAGKIEKVLRDTLMGKKP